MSKRKFLVEFEGDAIIELDDAVIEAVDDEWRRVFYKLYSTEDIVAHVACNLIVGARLSLLDGWADLSDGMAVLDRQAVWDYVSVSEIKGNKSES